MLPFAEKLLKEHDRFIRAHERGASWHYSRFYEEVNDTLDRAILRTGMELNTKESVVLAMDRKMMDDLSLQAVPLTRQGKAHGPQKEVHYPQKSVAVLTGLHSSESPGSSSARSFRGRRSSASWARFVRW